MSWKQFTAAFLSLFIIAFPGNIIGCGPDIDPYDYYTSFFYQNLGNNSNYKPFYYTGYRFLYDESEPVLPADELAKEWAEYAGQKSNVKDFSAFVNQFSYQDVNNLYYHIENKQALKVPDSVKKNLMTQYFLEQKDLEALGYILYAKRAEPFVSENQNRWEPVERDATKMSKLMKDGRQLYAAAKKDLFKLKYGYQILRLAHYSKQYDSAIKYYDQYIQPNSTASVLQPLSLSLKAGALYHMGQKPEAAYLFSKAFAENDVKKVSNFLSFFWSVNNVTDKENYLRLCKNDKEKSSMLAMFALNSSSNEVPTLEKIFSLNPQLNMLELLVTREVNKLEDNYFTPLLNHQKGGKVLYYNWDDVANIDSLNKERVHAVELRSFCQKMGGTSQVSNKALYQTAAAYLDMMLKDYNSAKATLAAVNQSAITEKVKDQYLLTKLLVTINSKEKIDADFEKEILPSLQWLREKALSENTKDYQNPSQWKNFYRNLMSTILAKKYNAQGDYRKEALAIGMAENIETNDWSNNYASLEFLRNQLNSTNVEKIYTLMRNKNASAFEKFMIKNNALKIGDIVDFAGTAFLRENKYEQAINWFNKASDNEKAYFIDTDPFIELLYDREEPLAREVNFTTTKLAFAKEMLRLEKVSKGKKNAVEKDLYKIALGLYNSTYYGHAWKLVQYYRSGSDGYYLPQNATEFQKQYYGCFNAHDYFKKAFEMSTDKNFKAKCLFMMAKCNQKIQSEPQYSNYTDQAYDRYDDAYKQYFVHFKYNQYFRPLVKEYSKTSFYQEALSSCSYLRDFVKEKRYNIK